jgi:hypothetical protein
MLGLLVPNLLIMGNPNTNPPPYDFLNLYGLPAGTKDPKNEVDNLPEIAG